MKVDKSKKVYVFKTDNTYYSINPYDANILSEARDPKTTFFMFPILSANGTKYYKEYAKNIWNTLKLKITGKAAFCTIEPDVLDIGDEYQISLESNDIAETFSLLGSLHNLELCCEELDSYTTETQTRPALMEFMIHVYSGGQEYKLDEAMYADSVDIDPENPDVRFAAGCPLFYICDLLNYLDSTLLCKPDYPESTSTYILNSNGYFKKYGVSDKIQDADMFEHTKKKDTNLVVLVSVDSRVYFALDLYEYMSLSLHTSSYNITYVVYENEPNSTLNDISIEELSVTVILELAGVDYEYYREDAIYLYSPIELMYLLVSARDIMDILLHTTWYGDDYGLMRACITYNFGYKLDEKHTASVNASIVDKNVREHDLVIDVCNYISAIQYNYEHGGRL